MIKKISLLVAVVFVVWLVASCTPPQTSFTPAPNCPSGQHAERAKSHQGKVWVCVK